MIFKRRKPFLGIVLSGGSANCLAHIDIIKVLNKESINIDMISGTNIGAIVGGIYALNPDIKYLIKRRVNLFFRRI